MQRRIPARRRAAPQAGTAFTLQDTAGTVFCADGGGGAQLVQTGSYPVVVDTARNPARIKGAQADFVARHNDGMNATFFDGHSKWFKVGEMGKMRPNPVGTNPAMIYPYFTKIQD